jgi:release factor glutamine methyltransferase
MFVATNTGKAVRLYMKERLEAKFSENEIRFFFRESIQQRMMLTPSELLLVDDLKFSESDLLYFRSIVKRLLEDEPFQHIIGHTYFYDLKINCTKDALVPRPETEELVDWIIQSVTKEPHLILDICTGSGCIALVLKSHFVNSKVLATDVSLKALNLAKKNAASMNSEINFVEHSVLDQEITELIDQELVDVVVANPPYIPHKESIQMFRNVLEFDPHLALFVPDEDPLIFYRAIAVKSFPILQTNGSLFFEIHELYGNEIVNLLNEIGYTSVELRKDLQGKNRMVKALK